MGLSVDWQGVRRTIRDMFWVVPDRVDADGKRDIAADYESVEKIEERWSAAGDEISELIHDRAQEFSQKVHTKADHVRSKATALFSASSFVSAVLFGLGTIYLRTVSQLEFGWSIVIVVLFTLMAVHFLRAIYIAIGVVRKEGAIIQSPLSISEIISDAQSVAEARLISAAQLVAFANKTDNLIKDRVNRLIIGQSAFRNGLIWFAIALVIGGFLSARQRGDASKQEDRMVELRSEVRTIEGELRELQIEVARLQGLREALVTDSSSRDTRAGKGREQD